MNEQFELDSMLPKLQALNSVMEEVEYPEYLREKERLETLSRQLAADKAALDVREQEMVARSNDLKENEHYLEAKKVLAELRISKILEDNNLLDNTAPTITYESRNRSHVDILFESQQVANSNMQLPLQNEASTVLPALLPEPGDQVFDKPKYPLFKGDPKEALDDFIKGKIFLPEPVLPGRMQPAIISTQKHPSTNVTGHMQEELLEFINAHWPYAGLSGVSSRSTPLPAIFDFNTSTLIEPINK